MPDLKLRWLVVVLLSCACAASGMVHARNAKPDAHTARFTRIDTTRGLAQNTVLAVSQDSMGFIWVASQNGLTRLDGDATRVYLPEVGASGGLSDNFISSLAVDRDGVLWVGTLEGLDRYDALGDRFERTPFEDGRKDRLPSPSIRSLHMAPDGSLWIASGRGLTRRHPADGTFHTWSSATGHPDLMPDENFQSITSAADGRVWVGSRRGLYTVAPGSDELSLVADAPFARNQVRAVLADAQGRLWVAVARMGLYQLDVQAGTWSPVMVDGRSLENALETGEIHSLLQRRNGEVWIGTDRGAVRLEADDPASIRASVFRHHRHDKASIGGGRVAALFEDGGGTLWLGTWNGGVSALRESGNLFESYTPDQPALSGMENPASIALLGMPGALWIGSGDGAWRFDLEQRLLQPIPGTEQLIHYVVSRVGDRFWVGTARGLWSGDLDGRELRREALPKSMLRSTIRRIMVDEQNIWVSADPAGLLLLDFEAKSVQKQITFDRQVTFIKRHSEQWIVVGSYGGLHWFDRAGNERFVHQVGRTDDPDRQLALAPMDFLRASDGKGWIGSNGAGVARIDLADPEDPASARFVWFDLDDGLDNGMLKAMLEDASGRIWMSTTRGISMLDPRSGSIENFGPWAGVLESDYINSAATTLPDGRLAFGGMDGFTVFDPERVLSRPPAPSKMPRIVGMEWSDARDPDTRRELDSAFRRAVTLGETLVVPASMAKSISFQFASMDPVSKSRPTFQYRLEPFDNDWNHIGSDRREASYTNLSPGKYRLRLRAQQYQMPWSEESHLDLQIEAFWWQSNWARLFGVLALISLVTLVYQLRMRQLSEQRGRLENLVARRTADLEDRGRALEEQRNRVQVALDELQRAQQELIRSEKMAALGQLVAGVAHEVNTPLGVAITAATHLRDSERQLAKRLEEGALRKSDLALFLETAEESTSMIERNLDRAGQLITNFKQVSVDRTSDGRRVFKLRPFLGEVLQSLELMWKRRSVTMQVECPEDVEMDSFPGALGQIITNLTQNAVVHAFDEESTGEMRIEVTQSEPRHIRFVFSDNGKGISQDDVARIFEPFFTTRRGQGGTGLGLNIVYNLVTQKLGGKVSVESQVGKGTRFVLDLPTRSPA